MPEDLLPDLKATAPIAVDVETLEKQGPALEQLWSVYLRQVGGAVEGMKGSALLFANAWRSIVRDVAGGQTAKAQEVRPRLLAALEHRLDLLKRTHTLARRLRQSHGEGAIPDPDVLLPDIAGMERLKIEVFDRWQTAEDLESLAVEHYPLSQAQLERVASTHPFPAEWYAGEEEHLFERFTREGR
jgi:hypothetical protein